MCDKTGFEKAIFFVDSFLSVSFNFLPYMRNLHRRFTEATRFLGKLVSVNICRPQGSKHPRFGFVYQLNYGSIPGTLSPDEEELDAYVLGVDRPLSKFRGRCVAVIRRVNDSDDKLIVVPKGAKAPTDEEIRKVTEFQEKYFKSTIIRGDASEGYS
jgi:inorganic pyrophosphatase